jgi:hypothetical protein
MPRYQVPPKVRATIRKKTELESSQHEDVNKKSHISESKTNRKNASGMNVF